MPDAPRRAAVDAPAKVNLALHVLERRPDGFHDLVTLFQAVGLADRVTVERRDPGSGVGDARVSLTVRPPGIDLGPLEDNLAVRAARAFVRATNLAGSLEIVLEKRIPAGAGLGGGSSDAAAVLRCLDALAGGRLRERLPRLALELGSDVPFLLGDGALAVGRGRGELLTPLEPLPEVPLVLALPPVHVSTAGAYRALADARASDWKPTSPLVGAGRQPTGWEEVCANAHNDFEAVVSERHAEVRTSLTALRAVGARVALLSGSGAASFGVFHAVDEAAAAAARLTAAHGWPFVAARTLRSFPEVVRED